jgi:hypothetical protein
MVVLASGTLYMIRSQENFQAWKSMAEPDPNYLLCVLRKRAWSSIKREHCILYKPCRMQNSIARASRAYCFPLARFSKRLNSHNYKVECH